MPGERFPFLAAVLLFLARGGRLLLLGRRNTGDEDGNYGVPAAPLDGGETVILATAREAREKFGIAIDPGELRAVGLMHRRSNGERIGFFVEAVGWRGEPVNREPDKCDELRWVGPAAPPTNTIPYIRRALDNWRRGVWFDRFGW